MRVEICAVSDIGRKRKNNEDICLVNKWSSAENDGVDAGLYELLPIELHKVK